MKHLTLAASALLLTASAPAFAGSFTYSNFTNAQNLTENGAATVSGSLVLTPNNVKSDEGAAYYNVALALGANPSFNTSFQFSIASPTTGPTANGFAFFLTTDPTNTGTAANGNMNLGLTPGAALAVEFSDFGNKVDNPPIGGGLYNSNLVAAITGGNTDLNGNSASSYGSPNGVVSCTGKQSSGNNCMNNGDVWTADISYVAGKLTVTVQDAAGQVFTVISGYAVALAGTFYAGFSGSTGGASDSVSILDWTFTDVPEPMTVGMFGVGVAALGFMRTRRRRAA
jgi:hypothetical protein